VQQLAPAKPKRQLVVGTWSRAEVAQHAAADDLWLIIKDQDSGVFKVYDVTDYIEEHPGGMAIMYNAGGDATEGFHGPQHPPTVHELIKDYCIGTLADP
jgi:cytochrome b involved in lipid metabolism